jgi:hypothetical protein
MLAAIVEFERKLIRERTGEGRKRAYRCRAAGQFGIDLLDNGDADSKLCKPASTRSSQIVKSVRDSGINVRGHGGYVVAPGIRMPNGGEYRRCPGTPSTIEAFENGTIPVLPPSLVKLLRAAPAPPTQTNEAARSSPLPPRVTPKDVQSREQSYAEGALRNQANELAATLEGSRNIELNNAALKMGHQVAAAGSIGVLWSKRFITPRW